MAITREQARAELARRELSRRESMQKEKPQTESIATQGLGYLKEHPFRANFEPAAKTITGKSLEEYGNEIAKNPSMGQSAERPFDKNLGVVKPAAMGLAMAGQIGDMITTPATYELGPALKVAGMLGGKLIAPITKGIGKIKAPFDESKVIQQNIDALKGEVGIPKKSTTEYIKENIINKEKDILAQKKQQIKSIKNYVSSKIDDIKLDKSEFDKNLLKNAKLTDFAKYMKESGVSWARKGTQKYGESIDKISSLIDDATPITANDSANLFKNIAAKAEAQGINSPMLGYVKNLASKYDDLAIKQFDAGVGEIPINFGTLKAEISGVNKYLSPGFKSGKYIEGGDRLASMAKSDWLDFMGKYMPEEGVESYSKLQGNYKQFADAKRSIGNMFHPYSGEFDLKAGIESAKKISLDKIDEGTKNLMNVLDKGIPDFVPGLEGFSGKVQGLSKIGQERKILDIFPGLIQKSGKLGIQKAENVAEEQMKQITSWKNQYSKLVELEKQNKEAKDKIWDVLKKVGVGGGILAGGSVGVDKLKQLAN